MRNGLFPGRFITESGRYAVFFTVVDPMDELGPRETFCDYQEQESRLARILGNHFKTQYISAILPAQESGLQFYQRRFDAVVLYDTLPAEFIEKAICMKTNSSIKEKAKDHVLCSKQIRNVNHKIYLVKK